MKSWRLALAGLAVCLAALLHVTCHQALFIAPPGSNIALIANPTFIPANTGVSVITAVVTEPNGTPVADGTVVQFFTDLGRVDEQGRTNDGVARVNLYADSRSGKAIVQAISGGPATTPSGSPSPSPSPGTGASGNPVVGTKAFQAVAAGASVEVRIGSANPAAVFGTASPQRITSPRYSTITANVFDSGGNAVSNVPVFFTVELPTGDGEPLLQESLDSAGSPRFTDNNGRASDILRTSYDPAERPKTVTVIVTLPVGGITTKVQVVIN